MRKILKKWKEFPKRKKRSRIGCVSISSSLLLVSFWKFHFEKKRKNWRSIRNFVFFHTIAFYFLFLFFPFTCFLLFILCFWLCSPNWDRASCCIQSSLRDFHHFFFGDLTVWNELIKSHMLRRPKRIFMIANCEYNKCVWETPLPIKFSLWRKGK